VTTTPDHHDNGGRRLSVADHQQGKTRVLARQCATCIFRIVDCTWPRLGALIRHGATPTQLPAEGATDMLDPGSVPVP
jgi:hypothetical protein